MKKFRLIIGIILIFSSFLSWYAPLAFKPSVAFLSLEGFITLLIGIYITLPLNLLEKMHINRKTVDWGATFVLLLVCIFTVYEAKNANDELWGAKNMDSIINQVNTDMGTNISISEENSESYLKQFRKPFTSYLNVGVMFLYLGFSLFAYYDWRNQKISK